MLTPWPRRARRSSVSSSASARDQLGLATPCDDRNVQVLLSHLVGTLGLGDALLSDRAPEVATAPGGLPYGDVLGEDPVKA